MVFRDQMNRELVVSKTPHRIISLVPSQTELLVDLGLEEALVGVTKFCVHPPSLRKQKRVVGGTKKVHFEKIKALNPDIILCNKEENTPEMVRELENIAPVHVSNVKTISHTLDLIAQYGVIFKVATAASKISNRIKEEYNDFQYYVKKIPLRKVAYFIWKDPWMVAGKDTFINYLLQLNKLDNVFSSAAGRYPETTLHDPVLNTAEIILLSTEPFPFKKENIVHFQKTFKNKKILLVNGEFFSWYGSRLLPAFQYFRGIQQGKLIY